MSRRLCTPITTCKLFCLDLGKANTRKLENEREGNWKKKRTKSIFLIISVCGRPVFYPTFSVHELIMSLSY